MKKVPWLAILLLTAATVLWLRDQTPLGKSPSPPKSSPASPKKPEPRKTAPPTSSTAATHKGGYEIYRNCILAAHHSNDGDSFLVRLPDGREETFRLYYVDTPESQFRRYQNGETNYERIRQQAAEMGGITPEKAVEIGKQGKAFTLELLGKSPFTLYTLWDSPFNDQRYHAFIEVMDQGKPRLLDELLIERGLARIKTKPAPLPDGTSVASHQSVLRSLQATARKNQQGVWKP